MCIRRGADESPEASAHLALKQGVASPAQQGRMESWNLVNHNTVTATGWSVPRRCRGLQALHLTDTAARWTLCMFKKGTTTADQGANMRCIMFPHTILSDHSFG